MIDKKEFMRNLKGLSIEAVKDIAWRHYARMIGLENCEVCDFWFDPAEEGGSTHDGVYLCGVHWTELEEEARQEMQDG